MTSPLKPREVVDRDSGRVHLQLAGASHCVGLEPAKEFWYRVYAEAWRRALGSLEWIWRYARQFVGIGRMEVVDIVDTFHAFEHVWTVGKAVFGDGSARAAQWMEPLKGEAGAGWGASGPGGPGRTGDRG